MDKKEEIERIETLAQKYFNEDKISKAIDTYEKLLYLAPIEKKNYAIYLNLLEDEFTIAELLWSAYEKSIACCNKAIEKLDEQYREYFYIKKLELYVTMADSNYNWLKEHYEEVNIFTECVLSLFPINKTVLKTAMALFRIEGNLNKEQELLDKAYSIDPNDFFLLISKIVTLEKVDKSIEAIEILEHWISTNSSSVYLDTAYLKMVDLSKKNNNKEKENHYQDLLDNK